MARTANKSAETALVVINSASTDNVESIHDAVNKAVDASIASSLANGEILRYALGLTLAHAAMHGRVEPLNRLFFGVTGGDANNVRLFIVHLNNNYGSVYQDSNGVDRRQSFLGFRAQDKKDAPKGFYLISKKTEKNETKLAAAKEMRGRMVELGNEGIMSLTYANADGVRFPLPVGPILDRAKAAKKDFDEVNALVSWIKKAIASRTVLDIRAINAVLPTSERFTEEKLHNLEVKADEAYQAELKKAGEAAMKQEATKADETATVEQEAPKNEEMAA